jgi:hypothetical protein
LLLLFGLWALVSALALRTLALLEALRTLMPPLGLRALLFPLGSVLGEPDKPGGGLLAGSAKLIGSIRPLSGAGAKKPGELAAAVAVVCCGSASTLLEHAINARDARNAAKKEELFMMRLCW